MWLMHFCKLHFIQTVIKSKGETGKQEKLWEGWIEPRSPGSYTCQIQERYQSTMGSRQFKQFVHLHAWLVKRRPPAEVNHCLWQQTRQCSFVCLDDNEYTLTRPSPDWHFHKENHVTEGYDGRLITNIITAHAGRWLDRVWHMLYSK